MSSTTRHTPKHAPPDLAAQQVARDRLQETILSRARADQRVLAVLDYGSTSEGRGDAWSDIDLAPAPGPIEAVHPNTGR